MSLAQELAELERQRGDEVHNLHVTYLRTKREVKRAVSPTRLVRKHLTLSLAAGALLGLLLAPRPAPRAVRDEVVDRAAGKGRRRRGGVSASWFKRVLAKFSPEAAQFIPDDAAASSDEPKVHEEAKEGRKQKTHGIMHWILDALISMIVTKIDWQAILHQVLHGMDGKKRGESHNGHEPQVSVADAGSVKPGDFENFE